MGLNSDLCCVSDRVQMQFEGDFILYQEDPTSFPLGLGTTNAALLDLSTGTKTVFTNNPTTHNLPVALAGGSFGLGRRRHGDPARGGGAVQRLGATVDEVAVG